MAIDILLLEMIKRISYAVILGLIVSRLKLFDRLMVNKLSWFDRIAFTVIFSSIAILGTYGGIPIQDALANSRMIGIMAAGLIGGPYLGTSVGIVSGLHRYSLGGFTALACAISSITEGFLAGLFPKITTKASSFRGRLPSVSGSSARFCRCLSSCSSLSPMTKHTPS